MLEVQASQTAITHASNPDVRAFAQRMVKDHTAVGDELKMLAGKKGIAVPDTLPADEQAKVDKLGTLEGAKYDRAYADEVGVKAHKEAVALFDKASKNAKDPERPSSRTTCLRCASICKWRSSSSPANSNHTMG